MRKINEVIFIRINWLQRIIVFLSLLWKVFLFCISSDYFKNMVALSKLRKESPKDSANNIFKNIFTKIPKNLDYLDFSGKKDIVTNVRKLDSNKYLITTKNGKKFIDRPGSNKQSSLYWFLKDLTQNHYTHETFFANSSVYRSYTNGCKRFPGENYLPGKGGIIIEAGAYVGFKAISFAEKVGPKGKVIAIEVNKENFDILKENIKLNKLESVIKPINGAISDKNGFANMLSKNRMVNTIVESERYKLENTIKVKTMTLEKVFSNLKINKIDYLNLQLNGAEIKALNGLGKFKSKIKYVNIITRYHKDGVLNVDLAKEFFINNGFKIIIDARSERLFNLLAVNKSEIY